MCNFTMAQIQEVWMTQFSSTTKLEDLSLDIIQSGPLHSSPTLHWIELCAYIQWMENLQWKVKNQNIPLVNNT
jgi:hypothetical protein